MDTIINYKKAEEIILKAEYITMYKSGDWEVHAIRDYISNGSSVGVYLDIQETNSLLLTVKNLFENYCLSYNNSQFYINKPNVGYDSIIFQKSVAIEITQLFKNSSDIINMFKSYEENLLFEYCFNPKPDSSSYSTNLQLVISSCFFAYTLQDIRFKDVEHPDTESFFIDLEQLCRKQVSARNNIIYTSDGYFKFYKLEPIFFNNTIEYISHD